MKITVGNQGRYNFHNVSDVSLRIAPENYIFSGKTVEAVKLTSSQIRRINRHYCGVHDCRCGSGPRGIEYTDIDEAIIHLEDAEVE